MIWKQNATLEALNALSENTLVAHLRITFTEIGPDYLKATMPVSAHTVQPYRLLHGGASAALAETLGSTAGVLCLEDAQTQRVVGVEINMNHLRAVREGGMVTAVARPLKVGRRIQVWNIEVTDQDERLVSCGRLTLAVLPNEPNG
ncbi:MAG: hotdog fold thioesterase [Bacteroidetes bacterium]|nr:MAG: hotdog fold thioesterase [Bacteroidota bacterium]